MEKRLFSRGNEKLTRIRLTLAGPGNIERKPNKIFNDDWFNAAANGLKVHYAFPRRMFPNRTSCFLENVKGFDNKCHLRLKSLVLGKVTLTSNEK